MKNILILLFTFPILTACPNETEMNALIENTSRKKMTASMLIQNTDYTLEDLLKIQEYFFDITEKIHLIRVDPGSFKVLKRLIKRDGVGKFCNDFIIPMDQWRILNNYCSKDSKTYKCSPEIKSYPEAQQAFKEIIGDGLRSAPSWCK